MGESVSGIWTWIVEKLIPPLVIFAVGATSTVALTVRDNSRALVDLRGRADALAARVESDNVARTGECAAVQARLGAVEARLGVNDVRDQAHLDEANAWKDRIKECEAQQRKSSSDPTARPDPFTGTQGRELEARIRQLEEYRAVDEHRMTKIEARLK